MGLEELVRELKRDTGQQLRELQVGCGEAQRTLSEAQAAADQRERQLRVGVGQGSSQWCKIYGTTRAIA